MKKNTKKIRNKSYKHDKKKRTYRKRKVNNMINIKIESRFKNLNSKTVKELINKFRKERLLHKNKHIINREQIGCSNKNNMMNGGSIVTDVYHKIEDFGTTTYNGVLGYPPTSISEPTSQQYLANNI